jgi:Site-specific recombinases, DNA invertase Pin homologs
MSTSEYSVGLYLRLSKEDTDISTSIENQQSILTTYARAQSWHIYDIYIDEGWSGTDFQRPAFERMMIDAREGRINLIAVKDLSRIGRNYIEVGRLTEETFPALGLRFIALGDQVDSATGYDEISIYRNIFNEFLSKEISRKVRMAKRTSMERGNYLGTYAPLGYRKDPGNKHHLLVDEENAPLVRRIFDMRASGCGYRAIALTLNEEQIPPPRVIYYNRLGKESIGNSNGFWSDITVKTILRNEVYLGHMVQGKVGTVSYKNHGILRKPMEQWVRVENMHEPIVTQSIWDTVQLLSHKKYKPRKTQDNSQGLFSGLLYCSSCGAHMKMNRERGVHIKDGSPYCYTSYICGNYARSGKTACSTHTINEKDLIKIVETEFQKHIQLGNIPIQSILGKAEYAINKSTLKYVLACQREMAAHSARMNQLDVVIQKLYEDFSSGTIPDVMFSKLLSGYTNEYERRSISQQLLQRKLDAVSETTAIPDNSKEIIERYMNLGKLMPDILLSLIERIEIPETCKLHHERRRELRIVYRFSDENNHGTNNLTLYTDKEG